MDSDASIFLNDFATEGGCGERRRAASARLHRERMTFRLQGLQRNPVTTFNYQTRQTLTESQTAVNKATWAVLVQFPFVNGNTEIERVVTEPRVVPIETYLSPD